MAVTPEYQQELIQDNQAWYINNPTPDLGVQNLAKFNFITQTCSDKLHSGNLDIVPTCIHFMVEFNKSIEQFFNETRGDIEKILLDLIPKLPRFLIIILITY